MGSKWIVVVRTATSDVTSEVTIEEFDTADEAQEHFDGLRSLPHARVLQAFLAQVKSEKV